VTAATAGEGTGDGPGVVYLLHLDPAYRHARHYIGWTRDLAARLEAHRAGRGARLMEVVKQAGGSFRLARTWPGDRDRERAIKNRHEAPKLCPECSPRPKPVTSGRASAHATTGPGPETTPGPGPQRSVATPAERGARWAEQFLRLQAGRTASQIEATFEYVTGPFREMGHHTPAQIEAQAAYTDLVTRHLAELRTAEHTATAQAPPATQKGDMMPSQAQASEAAGELASHRVSYALEHENSGPTGTRAGLVAARAARAMRDGDRTMTGTRRDWEAEPADHPNPGPASPPNGHETGGGGLSGRRPPRAAELEAGS
jgi:predicted GIY-YIG superfamily endonuclease